MKTIAFAALVATLTFGIPANANAFGDPLPFNPPIVHGYVCQRPAASAHDQGAFVTMAHLPPAAAADYFVIEKLLPDGSLDAAWGDAGVARMPNFPGTTDGMSIDALLPLADGSLIAIREGVVRFDPHGRIDTSFGDAGAVTNLTLTTIAAEQADGKVVLFVTNLSGEQTLGQFVRLTRDGHVDTAFGNNGVVDTNVPYQAVYAWSVLDDGSVEVGSFSVDSRGLPQPLPRLHRYPVDFQPPTRRLMPHVGVANWVSPAVKVDPSGGLLFAAEIVNSPPMPNAVTLTRFDASGNLDTTFGGAKVYVTGPETTFPALVPVALWQSADGGWTVLAESIAFVGDRLLDHTMRAARFLANGSADPLFPQAMQFSDYTQQIVQRDDASMVRGALFLSPYYTCSAARQSTDSPRIEATLIEYYNAQLDHYFMTLDGAESALLDANAQKTGWVRTGYTMGAWSATAPAGATPVCRFYGDPTIGPNSHFYTPQGAECDSLAALDRATPAGRYAWHLEGMAFSVAGTANGACADNLTPVYRLFNRKSGGAQGDPNHRYTTSAEVVAQMRAKGWALEGVAFCVPPPSSRSTYPTTF